MMMMMMMMIIITTTIVAYPTGQVQLVLYRFKINTAYVQNDIYKTTNSYTRTNIQYSCLLHTPQHVAVLKASCSGGTVFKSTNQTVLETLLKNLKSHSAVLKLSTKTLSPQQTRFTLVNLLTIIVR
jgi:hypothetical protein